MSDEPNIQPDQAAPGEAESLGVEDNAAIASDISIGSEDDGLMSSVAALLDTDRGDVFVRRMAGLWGTTEAASESLALPFRQLHLDLAAHVEETRALEQFVRALDPACFGTDDLSPAVPILTAITTRIIASELEDAGLKLDPGARLHLVRRVIVATRELLSNQQGDGLKPLSLVARHLVRHALRRGESPAALADALPGIAAKLPAEPGLLLRLERSGARQPNRKGRGIWGRPRGFVLHSPVEITILAR